ncbi:hypothetical protein [Endozoicomonas sp. 8E]|uniref:hypothetical protein n=1 Tax=Endozoicomonas sp. 8E TaxID=3035692 RepID=UPI0029395162|nr:hypothetical protein [Endozoicomonas sp. 8E]WOG27092.1 hypothetical protein P6910_21455 [Endozoicomonas sp. 8E]
MLLLSLSVACQSKPWTGRCAAEFEQKAVSPKQSFSIKPGRHTLPGSMSDITDTKSHSASTFLPDDKRQRRTCTTIIESISWQWLCATNLLIAYELILTSRDVPLCSLRYSWLPLEAVVTVGWLLKSFWNPDSLLFKKSEQQSASALTGGKHRFATITMMFCSGYDPQHYQPSEPPGQYAPQATIQPSGNLTHQLYSDSGDGGGDGDGNPQQHSHTLGLNCFVYPCRGACQFRPSSDSGSSAERPLNSAESSIGDIEAISEQYSSPHLADGDYLSWIGHFDPVNTSHCQPDWSFETLVNLSDTESPFESGSPFDQQAYDIDNKPANSFNSIDLLNEGAFYRRDAVGPLNDEEPSLRNLSSTTDEFPVINGSFDLSGLAEDAKPSCTQTHFPPPLETSETQPTTSESSQLSQSPLHLSRTGATHALSDHKSKVHTGQITCDFLVNEMNAQPQLCRKVFKSARSLSTHRGKYHTGQKTCDLTVIGKDGVQWPCGKVCKNAPSLSRHKRGHHTGQRTCVAVVVGENGQPRPCGTVCKNAQSLSTHKSSYHSGQKTCNAILVGENGQPQPCGIVFKNAQALFDHKKRDHSKQQTCKVNVVGEDGQLRPCGIVLKNAQARVDHKGRKHSTQKTCDAPMIGEDGQQRPCGRVCKSSRALMDHKRSIHSGQRTCAVTVVKEDGQQQPCGEVCKNAKVLADHKRKHKKRKPAAE